MSNMKYGLLTYKETKNIGDDIQSYAAIRFLPRIDYIIEREHLDEFKPNFEETVSVIMNGWFLYNKFNWPISDYINPFYISMHIWKGSHFLDYFIGDNFLDDLGQESLVKYGPVGCRDIATLYLLESKNIPSYFSACLTLTIEPKYAKIKKEDDYICLTDVSREVVQYVKSKCGSQVHVFELKHEEMVKRNDTWKNRFKNVESLLELYQNAKCVITTRIHCALPCLALQTPVLFLEDNVGEVERLEGLLELLNHARSNDLITGVLNYDFMNPIPNNNKYEMYSKILVEKCQAFIRMSETMLEKEPDRHKAYITNLSRRLLFKNKLLGDKYWLINNKVEDMLEYEEKLRCQISDLNNRINDLEYSNNDLIRGNSILTQQQVYYLAKIAEQEISIEELKSEQKNKNEIIAKLSTQDNYVRTLKTEINNLNIKIKEFEKSQWWKITRPGRALTGYIRKLIRI